MNTLQSLIPHNEIEALVSAHIRLQLGCYFSKSQPCLSGLVTTSRHIKDHYWNFLSSFKEAKFPLLLEIAIPLFEAEGRKPAVYLDPTCQPPDVALYLESFGYSCEREVWMLSQQVPNAKASCPATISRVDEDSKQDFLRVFSIGFGGAATSADGYGNLPKEYLNALQDSLSGSVDCGAEHVHLVARIDAKAVGCGSIHIGFGFAALYNVTTLPDHRNSGIGNAISLEAFNIARRRRGIKRVFFQTQPGGALQRFYESLGCVVIFEAAIFHKE